MWCGAYKFPLVPCIYVCTCVHVRVCESVRGPRNRTYSVGQKTRSCMHMVSRMNVSPPHHRPPRSLLTKAVTVCAVVRRSGGVWGPLFSLLSFSLCRNTCTVYTMQFSLCTHAVGKISLWTPSWLGHASTRFWKGSEMPENRVSFKLPYKERT